MIKNSRYTGINFSGWIQGVVMNKKSIFVYFKKQCFKDNVKTADWVGHLWLRSLDTDVSDVDEKQASLTGHTLKQSVSKGKTHFY